MTPLIIVFTLSALLFALAIWYWKMPERRWLNGMKPDGNLYGINYSKYNQKKLRTATIILLLSEAVGFFLIGLTNLVGLTSGEHPVLFLVLVGGMMAAPIVYWFVLLVFCKKSKYRKK